MKILHVIPSIEPSSGGPAEGLKQLCDIYHSGGHIVEVATLDSPERVKTIPYPASTIGLGPGFGVYGYSFRAISWLKKNIVNYDVVILNSIWQFSTLAAYRALISTRIPYAVFTHGMLDPYFRRRYPLKHVKKSVYWHLFLQRILERASDVYFTCEEEMILARQSFPRYRVHEKVVKYGSYGPDCDGVSASEEFLSRWPRLRGKRIAVSLGRIHPKKATDILIKAFAGSLAKDSEWHLVIAGPDQVGWQKELEGLAMRLGIADRIIWTGMLSGAVKWGAFFASEVFVLPSHQENFGIVVAEALACGLPVIISDKINIWREIENSQAGFVGSDTVEATTASLNRWSGISGVERDKLRSNSRRCFAEQFDYRQTSKIILHSVESLCRGDVRQADLLRPVGPEDHVPSNT